MVSSLFCKALDFIKRIVTERHSKTKDVALDYQLQQPGLVFHLVCGDPMHNVFGVTADEAGPTSGVIFPCLTFKCIWTVITVIAM